jgi:uncharacterized protein YbjQ (UPF0145 family)
MHTVDLNQVAAADAVAALRKYAAGGMLGNMAMGGGIGAGIGAGGGLLAEYMSGRKRKDYLNAMLGGGAMGGVLGAGAGAVYNGMSSGSKDPASQSAEEQRMAELDGLRKERFRLANEGDQAGVDRLNKKLNDYGDTSPSPPVDETGPAIGRFATGAIGGSVAAQALPAKREYTDANASIKDVRGHQANNVEAALAAARAEALTKFKADARNLPVDLDAIRLESQYQPVSPTPKDQLLANETAAYRSANQVPDSTPLNKQQLLDIRGTVSKITASENQLNTDRAKQLSDRLLHGTRNNEAIEKRQQSHVDVFDTASKAVKAFPASQHQAAAAAQIDRSQMPHVPNTGPISLANRPSALRLNRVSSRFDLPAAVASPVDLPAVQAALPAADVAAMSRQHRVSQFAAAKLPVAMKSRAAIGGIAGGVGNVVAPWVARSLTSAFAPTKPTP